MGGSVAGPFGAGGGLVLGLIFGLSTADSHYEQLNGQILAEQAKDKELEAQLEQEIERQRELEAQLEKSADTSEQIQREGNTDTAGNRGPAKEIEGAVSTGALFTAREFPLGKHANPVHPTISVQVLLLPV